jgi:hypothetical protein
MVMNAISGFLNTTGESTSSGVLNEMHYLPSIISKSIPATGKEKIYRDIRLLLPTLVINPKKKRIGNV